MTTNLSIFQQAAQSFETGDNAGGNTLLSQGYTLEREAQPSIARKMWEIKGSPLVISEVAFAKSCFETEGEASAEEKAAAVNAYIQAKWPLPHLKSPENFWALRQVFEGWTPFWKTFGEWVDENALLLATLLHR